MRTPRPLAALVTALALTAAAACGGDDAPAASSDPAAAGSASDTVVLYSGRDEQLVQPLIDDFVETTGIQVEVRYGGTTELAAQLIEEGAATPAHVFLSQDAGALGALANEGLFAALPADVTSAVDPALTSTDGSWVGLTGRARVVGYDSEELARDEVPTTLEDLLDPRWRGQIAVAPTNASFQAFVTAVRVTEGEQAARDFLEGLLAQEPQIFEGNGAIVEAVEAGTVDLGLINHYYWARSETDPTALRMQVAFGEPGSPMALVNVTGAGILTGAADLPAAEELVRFLVSDEAQAWFATETSEYPLVPGVDGPADVPALAELEGPDLDLSDLDGLQDTVSLLTDVGML